MLVVYGGVKCTGAWLTYLGLVITTSTKSVVGVCVCVENIHTYNKVKANGNIQEKKLSRD